MTTDSSGAMPISTFPASIFKKLLPLDFLRLHLERNIRPSGRSLLESRQLTLSHTTLSTTSSNTVVRLGNTTLICSITAQLSSPSIESPEKGYIVPNIVLSPLSNPKHKPGPPSDEAQSLSAQMLALISAVSPELQGSLCVERGKCVWTLFIDVEFLNFDGNAFDAAWLGITATLSRVVLPPVKFNVDLGCGVVVDGVGVPVEWGGEGVFACSFVGIDGGKYILIDPDQEEEELATASICVVIDQERRIRHLYKGGIGLGREDIKKCVELASERAGYLSFILEESASKLGMST